MTVNNIKVLFSWALLMIAWLGFDAAAKDLMLVAHRGASRYAPENTIPAFKLAWQQGADAIEGDFHLTKDGHIVCIHDGNTKKVSKTNLVVSESTLDQLRKLDVGVYRGQKFKGSVIPTIGEVFSTVPENKKIYVEIKCGAEIIDALLDQIKKSGLRGEQVVVISFNKKVIEELKRKAPEYKAYWLASVKKSTFGKLTPSPDTVLATLKQIKADGFSSSHDYVNDDFIERIKAEGYEYHVWTVDDAEVARRFSTLGARSITTNVPGYLRRNLTGKNAGRNIDKASRPVKVFILAGQSNMVGAGLVDFEGRRRANYKKRGMTDEQIAKKKSGTLASLAKNPQKTGMYKHIVDEDGEWVVRDDVWVYYNRDKSGLKTGGLTVGFGANDDKIGPEFQFGHVLGDYYEEQVLLIKTAWGGKSLAVDFRPPGAGKPTFENKPDRFGNVREPGKYYRLMMAEVKEVLGNLKKYFPDYEGQGYEIVGFGWHQGWNDGASEIFSQQYGMNMPIFIKDVRKDLGVKNLPFVIANSGFGGRNKRPGVCGRLQKLVQPAQAATAEKMDNVECLETRDYYRAPEESPGHGDIEHWYSNAESYFLIGDGMGKAMKKMVSGK